MSRLRRLVSGLAAAALLAAVAPAQAAQRPPIPAGGKQLSPGHVPAVCSQAEFDAGASTGGSTYGYYYSKTAKTWISAPLCYSDWGFLDASASQIVGAGQRATVTAIPNQGSNSAQYAPETKTILWTFPGRRVAGCGNADLTCTVVLAKRATSEWQWGEFHVTMPRTFFVDSPGSNCAGQHLCAGFATNAWSFVGVPPKGTSAPPPPGSAKLCLGGCGSKSVVTPTTLAVGDTSLEVTAGCGGASLARVAQAGGSCPVNAKLEGTKKELTERQKIEEAESKQRLDRQKIMADLQKKIFDVTQDITINKTRAADKAFHSFDGYIHSNAGSPDVVAALGDADSSLSSMFPPTATAARAYSAQASDGSAVLRSLYDPKASSADAAAYTAAVALATSPTASFERSRARLLLSIGVIIGRRVVADELGSKRTFAIASDSVRVPAGGERSLTLKANSLGARALRILGIAGLSRKTEIELMLSSSGRSASRAISIGAPSSVPTAAAAALKYRNCDGKKYLLLSGDDPAVKLLRIKMRNAKADGYAPRCLVAEAVAAQVQGEARYSGKHLKTLDVYGARWGIGKFRCTYETKSAYVQASCVHTGKDAATVRFRLV